MTDGQNLVLPGGHDGGESTWSSHTASEDDLLKARVFLARFTALQNCLWLAMEPMKKESLALR